MLPSRTDQKNIYTETEMVKCSIVICKTARTKTNESMKVQFHNFVF